MATEEKIRTELTGLLPDLSDGEWEWLVRQGRVGEVLDKAEGASVEALASWLREVRLALSGRVPTKRAGPMLDDVPEVTHEVLSFLFAREAAERPAVQEFRQEVLGGSLVPWAELDEWIAERVGEGTVWLEVPVPAGHAIISSSSPRDLAGLELPRDIHKVPLAKLYPDPPLTIDARRPVESGRGRALSWSSPGSSRIKTAAVTIGSDLDRLWRVAKGLSGHYGWQEEQATVFVLTGETPVLEPVRVQIDYRYERAATRIILEVDPRTKPQEVARRFQEVRANVSGGRLRQMSEKHLRLAAFIADHPDGTWADRMKVWNKEHPDPAWQYDTVNNFNRDALKARRRVLEPPY